MRPDRYRDYLLGLLEKHPDVEKVKAWEGGPYPYALAVMAAGRIQRWQLTGQLADGAQHHTPTPDVPGQPPAFSPAPADGAADAWMAAVIGGARPADTRRIRVWPTREGKDSRGVTVYFHNGERVFLRLI